MKEIIQLAGRLGALIAGHERFLRLRRVENAVQADAEAREALDKLEQQRQKVAELEANLKPVEPEDKRELERLAGAVRSCGKLQELLRAQADYLELMRKVNEAIRAHLGVENAGASSRSGPQEE